MLCAVSVPMIAPSRWHRIDKLPLYCAAFILYRRVAAAALFFKKLKLILLLLRLLIGLLYARHVVFLLEPFVNIHGALARARDEGGNSISPPVITRCFVNPELADGRGYCVVP